MAFLLLFAFAKTNAQNIFVITETKKSIYKIVLPANPTLIEKEAAQVLSKYLAKVTGTELPIVSDSSQPYPFEICIGNTNRSVKIFSSNTVQDATYIGTKDKKIFINGGARKGVLYAAYTFLEKYVGCRKFTANFEVIPNKPDLTVSLPSEDFYNPIFEYRSLDFKDIYNYQFADWHKVNYFFENRKNPAHSFFYYLPETLFKTHPEYFSLVGGKRQPIQPCLSNPEVLKIIKANLAIEMKKNPANHVWSVSQIESDDYCHCNLCEPKHKAGNGFVETLIPFVNKLADAFPDKTISTLAYRPTLNPPKNSKIRQNVEIMFCFTHINRAMPIKTGIQGSKIFNGPDNAAMFRNILADWKKLTNNIFAWDYVVNFTDTMSPFPNFKALQPNVQYMADNNIKKLFLEGYGNQQGEFSELRTYILAKLLWNPNIDVEAITDEFISNYYGAAAPEIKTYFSTLEDIVMRQGATVDIWAGNSLNANDFLSSNNIDTYNKLFERALSKVRNNETVYNRVLKEYISVQYAEVQLAKKDPLRLKKMGGNKILKNKINKLSDDAVKLGIEYFSFGHKTPNEYRQIE